MNLSSVMETKVRQEVILWENIKHEYAIWYFTRCIRTADFINDIDGKHLLDAGCGIGLLDNLIVNKEIVGIDIDRKNIRDGKQIRKIIKLKDNTVHTLVADLYFLPFKEKFDIVICTEVLEHLAENRIALATLLSVLREGGFLLITVPNILRLEFSQLARLALRAKYLCPYHLREYKVSEVYNLIKSFPLRIEKITGVYFDFPLFHVFYLPTRVPIRSYIPLKFRFFVYRALYRIYATFWMALERLFWHHAYYILIILKKSHHQ